jgi:hypothetical protein
LVNDKFDAFQGMYGPLGVRVIRATGDIGDEVPALLLGRFDIALLTYEKFTGLALAAPHVLEGLSVVVVDEVQTLVDPGRGPRLEFLLTLLRARRPDGVHPQLVALSAVLGDLGGLDSWLDARPLVRTERPVPLAEGVLRPDGTWRLVDPADGAERESTACVPEPRKGTAQDLVIPLVRRLVGASKQVLVFRSTKSATKGCAAYLSRTLGLPPASAALEALPSGDPKGFVAQGFVPKSFATRNEGLRNESSAVGGGGGRERRRPAAGAAPPARRGPRRPPPTPGHGGGRRPHRPARRQGRTRHRRRGASRQRRGCYVSDIWNAIHQLVNIEMKLGSDELAPLALRYLRAARRRLDLGQYQPSVERELQAALTELAELTAWLLQERRRWSTPGPTTSERAASARATATFALATAGASSVSPASTMSATPSWAPGSSRPSRSGGWHACRCPDSASARCSVLSSVGSVR